MPRSLLLISALLAVLVALGLGWQWLALEEVLTVEALLTLAKGSVAWRDASWAVLVIMGVYAGASLVMFPLSLLLVGLKRWADRRRRNR